MFPLGIQTGWLNVNITIIEYYYTGHQEALQAYAMCTWTVTVYAQSTMCACTVYTSTTTFQPLVGCL